MPHGSVSGAERMERDDCWSEDDDIVVVCWGLSIQGGRLFVQWGDASLK